MAILRELEQERIKSLKTQYQSVKENLIYSGFAETKHPDVLEFKSSLNFVVQVHLESEGQPYLLWDYYDIQNDCMVSEATVTEEREIRYSWENLEAEAINLVKQMINGNYPEY